MLSSRRFSIAGSKAFKELQSSGLRSFREAGPGVEEGTTDCGEEAGEKLFCDAVGDSTLVAAFLAIAKVKEVCLSATFSLWTWDNRSRRFSFSCWARSFFASSSATLSSS